MVGVVGSSPIVPTRIPVAIIEMAQHEKAHFSVCFFVSHFPIIPSASMKHQDSGLDN